MYGSMEHIGKCVNNVLTATTREKCFLWSYGSMEHEGKTCIHNYRPRVKPEHAIGQCIK